MDASGSSENQAGNLKATSAVSEVPGHPDVWNLLVIL